LSIVLIPADRTAGFLSKVAGYEMPGNIIKSAEHFLMLEL